MNFNRIFKTNTSKIIALLVLFAIIAFFGGLLFSWGYRFQKRTWFLRGSYMAIAVLWVVLSIRAICVTSVPSVLKSISVTCGTA